MGKRNKSIDLATQVSAQFESLRLERGLFVRNLAQTVKCSTGYLSLMESGLSSINVCTLEKIAQALEVEPFDLLNHTPENENVGYIIEKMRQDPAALAKVKAQLEAWNAMAAVAS